MWWCLRRLLIFAIGRGIPKPPGIGGGPLAPGIPGMGGGPLAFHPYQAKEVDLLLPYQVKEVDHASLPSQVAGGHRALHPFQVKEVAFERGPAWPGSGGSMRAGPPYLVAEVACERDLLGLVVAVACERGTTHTR